MKTERKPSDLWKCNGRISANAHVLCLSGSNARLPNLVTPGGAVSTQTVQVSFALVLQPEAK